ncbi:GGDEF domain-containing protein [Ottowia sp.]|uniref:GGDEF domain-containing protein n=1 Tax=Ottowia sp. TaxID=1898956 RepID=UPI0025F19E98|nr:GGDEF domain-containing protein [Ottowia sp.]MBK6616446.1 GGDEF domain-containing protein [Ottowia sp.]
MIGLYQTAIAYFGAHSAHLRDKHEVDRAIQRAVIGGAISIITMWFAHSHSETGSIVAALPYAAAAYAALAMIYLKIIQSRPNAAIAAQYLFILLDPALTVLALAGMPGVLAPINQLLVVQIVRCGIRYGVRTMWLTWAAAALSSMVLLPLNTFWSLAEPLTKSYITMLAITPILFGPLIKHLHRVSSELRSAATSDPLTGLGNRRMLSEHLRLAQERSHRDHSMLAVLLIDLDNFKAVNDTLGHGIGDHLLERVASAIKHNSRGGDFLARIGGDEFVLLVEGLSHHDGHHQAQMIAEKIVKTVQAVAEEVSPTIPVSASIGVNCWSFASKPLASEIDLIEVADRAMYSAKRAGKARVVLAPA